MESVHMVIPPILSGPEPRNSPRIAERSSNRPDSFSCSRRAGTRSSCSGLWFALKLVRPDLDEHVPAAHQHRPDRKEDGHYSAPEPVPELRDSLGILHLVHDPFHPPPLLARNVLANRMQQFFEAPGTQHVVLVDDRDDQPALGQDELDVIVEVELEETIHQRIYPPWWTA